MMISPRNVGRRLPRSPLSSPQQTRRHPTIKLNYLALSIALIALYLLSSFMILITFDMDSDDNITRKDTTAALNTLHNNHRDESSSSLSSQQVGGIRNRKKANERKVTIDYFCGACKWKDADFTCNERVVFEVTKRKVSVEEAKIANLEFCIGADDRIDDVNKDRAASDDGEEWGDYSRSLNVSDFCGICKWKEKPKVSCAARALVKTSGSTIEEAKMANLQDCFDPSGRFTNDMGDFILSPICGGCYRAKNGTKAGTGYSAVRGLEIDDFGTECNSLQLVELRKIMKEKNDMTIVDKVFESNKVVAQKHKDCEICNVDTCWKRFLDEDDAITKENKRFDTKYWRFDKAAPKISKSVALVLPSLPEELRIPSRRHEDIEDFLTEKYDAREETDRYIPFLVEYNPSLVQIPLGLKPSLPHEAAYLTTLRVTPANNCFKEEVYSNLKSNRKEVWDSMMWTSTNHLGLAVLDRHYQMIPGYDAIIDLANEMKMQKTNGHFGVEPSFMDYRLATLNGEVYLNINTDTVIITKLMIRSKDFVKYDRRYYSQIKTKRMFNVKPLYGGEKLDITLLHQFNTIWSGGSRGKNYALFTVPNATHPNAPDSIYAEINVNPYHKVSQIYPDEIEMLKKKDVKTRTRRNYMLDGIMQRKVKHNNATVSNRAPHASFSTVDEHWFPGNNAPFEPFSPVAHGGACCIELRKSQVLPVGNAMKTFGDHEYLLVGIAHSPVKWKHWYNYHGVPESDKALLPFQHYVSFLYAFEPYPPFNLRARSGYFCLGYPGEDEGTVNPNSVLTFNRKLRQHNETFNCAQIHFVSTLVEKVDEDNTIVIGFGLNDCTSRLVEVSKQEIAKLLFPDPLEMNLQERK
mmetsp:Transcript_34072/g.69537  ORF Transcript_34072/g.69537 Transcript_34072/m.69537 type:complete len:861 (-) Transcript_34072:776-3358(-)